MKCVVRRFRHCENVIECTYTTLDSVAYYTPRLYCTAYCSLATKPVQHVTVQNSAGNCNTMVSLSQYLTNLMRKICFTASFISCLYMFRANVLIIRRSKLHYTASGIITRIGGRLVHETVQCNFDLLMMSTCARNM